MGGGSTYSVPCSPSQSTSSARAASASSVRARLGLAGPSRSRRPGPRVKGRMGSTETSAASRSLKRIFRIWKRLSGGRRTLREAVEPLGEAIVDGAGAVVGHGARVRHDTRDLATFPSVSALAPSRPGDLQEGRCTHRGRSARLASWPHWRWRSAPPAASAARSTRSRPPARSSSPSGRPPPPSPAAVAAILSWTVTGATSVSIAPGVGAVTGTSVAVRPSATTTYVLSATNAGGPPAASVTVTVTVAPAPPRGSPTPCNPATYTVGHGHHAERPVEHRRRHHLLRGEPGPPGRPRR